MISSPDLKRNLPYTKKEKLFRLFHSLTYEFNSKPYLYFGLLFLQMLQFIYFAIHPSRCQLWPTPFTRILQTALGYISMHLVWQNTVIAVSLACTLALLFAYTLALALIIYQIYSGSRTATTFHEFKIKFMQYLSILSRTVLTIPITILILSIAKKFTTSQTFISNLTFTFAICLLVLYLAVTYLFLEFHIDSSPFSKLPWAGSVNFNEKYKFIFKIILSVFIQILPSSCNSNYQTLYSIFITILMAYLLFLLYLQYTEPNLIYNSIRAIYEYSFTTSFSIYLTLFTHLELHIQQSISLFFICVFCVFTNFSWIIIKGYRQKYIVYCVYRSLTSKKQIMTYNYLLSQYIRDFKDQPLCLIKLEGILSDHIMNCKKLDEVCQCRVFSAKIKQTSDSKSSIKIKEQIQGWFVFIKNNLSLNAQKINHLPEFHIMLSQIEQVVLGNKFMAYINLEKCSSKNSSAALQYLIFNQKRIIQKELKKQDVKMNELKQIDINKFLQMDAQIGTLQQKILKSSLQHLQFWNALSNSTQKKKSAIMREGNNLLLTVKQCQNIYKNITQKYPNNLQSIILFSNYAKYILNDHELIGKSRNTFNLIKKKIFRSIKVTSEQEKQKYGENAMTATFVISGQKHNVGTIKACSSKVTNILKYAGYELIGQNINTLMPSFISNMHNEVLISYLQQSQSQFDYKQRYVPMIDRNNFMVLGKLLTKPLPNLINGLELLGVLEKIKEFHIRHGQQVPKYILYRSDTGRVQALSQSFYTQFGFRLTKLNQFSEVSEQLNFNYLFNGLNEQAISNNQQGTVCEMKTKKSFKKQNKVKAYLRHQFNFFGVKVKLLYLFSNQNNQNSIISNAGITMNPMINSSPQQKNDGEPNQTKSIQEKNVQITKDKTPYSQQIKKLKGKLPLKLKIFRALLGIFLASVIAHSIWQLASGINQVNLMKGFQYQNQNAYKSQEYLINIGYYTRMMQLSSKFSTSLPKFNHYRSNISILTNKLQQTQFQLVNKQSQIKSLFNFQFPDYFPLEWQVNQQQTIFSSQNNLHIAIFDIVTSSSSFSSANPSDFLFSFDLASNKTAKNNLFYRNLFQIRYTILYELIQSQSYYLNNLTNAYSNKISKIYDQNKIQIGLGSVVITLLLIVMIRMLYRIIQSIYSITVLFNWLTPSQIGKQIFQCQNFLQHFFSNCYQVTLKFKKYELLRSDTFNSKGQKDFQGEIMQTLGPSAYDQIEQYNKLEGEVTDQIDIAKISNKNIVQKQENKTKNGQFDENEPLKKQQQSTDPMNQNQNQNKQSVMKNFIVFLPILLTFLAFLMLFIGVLQYRTYTLNSNTKLMSIQNLLHQNLLGMIKLKYYGLQLTVDPSQFQKYNSLNMYFNGQYGKLYQLQQNLSKLSQTRQNQVSETLFDLMLQGICNYGFTTNDFYTQEGYSKDECQSIDNGILSEGLRVSMVAYIENIANTTSLSSPAQLASSSSFQKIIKMDKYLQSSLTKIAQLNRSIVSFELDSQFKVIIIWFCLQVLAVFFIAIIINSITSSGVMYRISGTFQIISLIPSRIFNKNQNLYAEYKKNVQNLFS